jgi:hypothetical protein
MQEMLGNIAGENIDFGHPGEPLGGINFLYFGLRDAGEEDIDPDLAYRGDGRVDISIFVLDEDGLKPSKLRESCPRLAADIVVVAGNERVVDNNSIEVVKTETWRKVPKNGNFSHPVLRTAHERINVLANGRSDITAIVAKKE